MSKILISYRRDDSADVTGRIYDRLRQEFGSGAVFKDVDSIPFGVDFRKHLDAQVAKCEVFLAVIGRDWIKKRGSKSQSRLEDPKDFVRIEVESALTRDILIIPVLVSGAVIPPADRLPASMQDLSYRNGLVVHPDPDFHRDMDRLIDYLKQQITGLKEPRVEADAATPQVKQPVGEAPFEMVKVPKGPFLYGEKKTRETIDHDYWIDQYPVTNEKYRAFVLADGYGNQAYWSVDGWTWKTKHNIVCPEYWNNTTWNKADHPVVGVSYYEAAAYATWAGKRLPTEREWEKAARGEDGRQHPWGEEFDKKRCNSNTSDIGDTTPVTQYPQGVSPYGCYDMAGNVWDWCMDWYDEDKDSHILRGGSWYNAPVYVRSAFRVGFTPSTRYYSIGFRCAQDLEP